jgi:hypothetical protein
MLNVIAECHHAECRYVAGRGTKENAAVSEIAFLNIQIINYN